MMVSLAAIEGYVIDIDIIDNDIERAVSSDKNFINVGGEMVVSIIVNNKYRVVCLERGKETFADYFERTYSSIKLALEDKLLNPIDKIRQSKYTK